MDYEGLMNGVMVIINLHMNMYDNLKKEASEKGDEKRADIYDYKYKAVRDVKMEIDKLALKKKNREEYRKDTKPFFFLLICC